MNPRLTGAELAVLMEAAGTASTGVVGSAYAAVAAEAGHRPGARTSHPAHRGRARSRGADGTGADGRRRRALHQRDHRDPQGSAPHAWRTGPPGRLLFAVRRSGPGRLDHVRPARARRGDAGVAGGLGPGLDHGRPDPLRRGRVARPGGAARGDHRVHRAHHAVPDSGAPRLSHDGPELTDEPDLRGGAGHPRTDPAGHGVAARCGADQHVRPDRDDGLDHRARSG